MLITLFVFFEIKNADKLKSSIKIYLISAFIVSIWGLLQLLTHYTNVPYPAFLFNNSASDAVLKFISFTGGDSGMARINSVAVEPSIFARYMLSVIPLALILYMKKVKLFSSLFTLFCFIVVYVLVLILTLSTSAYLGIAFMFMVLFFYLKKYRELKFFLKVIMVFLLIIIAIAFIMPEWFYNLIQMTFYKPVTFSGMERIFASQEALGLFSAYPLLGVGWGSNTSFDLISYLLANSGLFGALCFALFVLSAYKHFRWLQKNNNIGFETKAYTDGIGLSLLTGIFLNLTGGLDLVFLHLWFLLGLMLSLSKITSHQTTKNRGSYNEI